MAKLNYTNRCIRDGIQPIPSPRLKQKATAREMREERKSNAGVSFAGFVPDKGYKNLAYLRAKGVIA